MQCTLYVNNGQVEEKPSQWYFNRRKAQLMGYIVNDATGKSVAIVTMTEDDKMLHFSTVMPRTGQFDGVEYANLKDFRPKEATLQ